jgi:hypothetical protein
MRVGLHALGIGTGARPQIIRAVAMAAETGGFATLWAGEHVVLVDEPRSRYPYSADGRIAVPADADWLLATLAGYCRDRGRELTELSTAVALSDGTPGLLPELAETGVSELVVVGAPPADPARATAWVADLAARWMPGTRYTG